MEKNDLPEVTEAIRSACQRSFGPLDSRFLCASISTLNPSLPVSVIQDTSLQEVMNKLQSNKIGCVLVLEEEDGKLVGIFSERDYVLKVYGNPAHDHEPIKNWMTAEPVTLRPEDTVAHALTLLSQGGFRHLPVVDDLHLPIGLVSVKDLVDSISARMMDELLQFS